MTQTNQVRNLYPAMRIFVFGIEVTKDLTTCTLTYNDKTRAPGTAEFVLTSKHDRYITTERDIHAMYDPVDITNLKMPDATLPTVGFLGSISELSQLIATNNQADTIRSSLSTIDKQIRARVKDKVTDTLKHRVLSTKITQRQVFRPEDRKLTSLPLIEQDSRILAAPRALNELINTAWRYPVQVGDCIFHSNDPVRIFWRDPFNPANWYHMFAGFVTDYVDSVDENNTSLVTIRCEDVLRVLRYARVAFNPGFLDIGAIKTELDEVKRRVYAEGFPNLTLPEIISTFVFGSAAAGTEGNLRRGLSNEQLGSVTDTAAFGAPKTFSFTHVGPKGETTQTAIPADGAGAFDNLRSVVVSFNADGQETAPDEDSTTRLKLRSTTLSSLADYQALVDHRVLASDLINMSSNELSATAVAQDNSIATQRLSPQRKIENTIKLIGEQPHIYPIEGRLVMLIPSSLGPDTNRNLVLRDLVQLANETEFRSRLGVIYDIVERIEFSFYASPKGDLLCEMPLYDFDPVDFGTAPVRRSRLETTLKRNSRAAPVPTVLQNITSFEDEVVGGPGGFASHFHIPKRDTVSWERTFSDEQIRTQMVTYYSPIQIESVNSRVIGIESIASAPDLFPQFGARLEKIDTNAIIPNKEAADIYANILLQQTNANARTANVNVLPRISVALPNRPLLFDERKFIGTTRSITHSLMWGKEGSMESQFNVNYIRGFGGMHDRDGNLVYTHIGSFAEPRFTYAINKRRVTNVSGNTPKTSAPRVLPVLPQDPNYLRLIRASDTTVISDNFRPNADRLMQSFLRVKNDSVTALVGAGASADTIRISSGFRTQSTNESAEGTSGSRHHTGEAMDMVWKAPHLGLKLRGISPYIDMAGLVLVLYGVSNSQLVPFAEGGVFSSSAAASTILPNQLQTVMDAYRNAGVVKNADLADATVAGTNIKLGLATNHLHFRINRKSPTGDRPFLFIE